MPESTSAPGPAGEPTATDGGPDGGPAGGPDGGPAGGAALGRFSAITREWFEASFTAPTAAQAGAWDAISRGRHTLVVAPTGSGKTLAAFLWALDRLSGEPAPQDRLRRCRVLYVSPLKALAVDVERNLRAPLTGLGHTARRLGVPEPQIEVAVRSGDTPADARRKLARTPPDVLITTPESLFLLLTSQARESLRGVETVILDEVHATAGTKRGAHLALCLERLDDLLPTPAQRVGLSATVRPVPEIARWLAGAANEQAPVEVVQPPSAKTFDLDVVVPVEDMQDFGDLPTPPEPTGSPDTAGTPDAANGASDPRRRASIWPHVEERVVDLVHGHRSTLIFANSRRLAERLTARLNEIHDERVAQAGDDPEPATSAPAELMGQAGAAARSRGVLARSHHGSVSKDQRAQIEDDLKTGRLPCVVATSSLELGIDMGAVDLVVQVEAPPSVASGLQRVGRAGHQVGAISRGTIFPKYRGDLVATAVVTERMRAGLIEATEVPANPLDVLAQQIVAAVSVDDWEVDALYELVRRAAAFHRLPRSSYDAVLDMLTGRYPSEEFAELRPRLVWDRVAGTLSARPGAQRLAVTSGGTIPDRGLFGVFLAGESGAGRRVGELDEEMVYESRVGDVFTLGSTSWRIEDITHDRVLVTPAPGQPGRLPFWKGDVPSRPAELGRATGAFIRELSRLEPAAATTRARDAGLDAWAADNLVSYLDEQRRATGHLPTDQTIVVERFRDELGDWRVCVHSPLGEAVHAPWALAIAARLRERYGVDAQAMHADDGVVLRVPDTEESPPGADLVAFAADEIEELVTAEVGSSALFAARFRECAARALLLPRRDPNRRSPLWQQRQRSAQLLAVASKYATFPIVLETIRECLNDVYDVPSLVEVLRAIERRRIRVVEVETTEPSPFARSLTFGYIAAFMYEGDAPLAERRAAALALDPALLAELLGRAELRELLDPDVLAATEAELQRLPVEVPDQADRRCRDAEGVADLLRLLGPLSTTEIEARCVAPEQAGTWVGELATARRAISVRMAGADRWAAVEDAGRLRDALGIPLPVGVPAAFTEPVVDPLGDLVARYARTHGPFHAGDVADRFGLGVAVVTETLHRLAGQGRVSEGEFRPAGHGSEWCETGVLRTLRRRSLAASRSEVEPVEPRSLARFLPEWQHHGHRLRGVDGLVRVIEQLAGCAVPASALEPLVLASRVSDYSPAFLDELTTAGEVIWAGHGGLPGNDGWVSLHLAETAPVTLPDTGAGSGRDLDLGPTHHTLLDTLSSGGGYFFRQLADAMGATDDQALASRLWELVWAGLVTGDSLAPLRALTGSGRTTHRSRPRTPRGRLAGRSMRSATARTGGLPSRPGPPTVAGRWSLLPERDPDPTRRAHAAAEALLDRHGVVTRGAVQSEQLPGGFARIYRVLSTFEESGHCRRGYFVAGLGAAQFGTDGAVDRLRAGPSSGAAGTPATAEPTAQARVLAATDPANPYGAALVWPEQPETGGETPAHRPGRKAGALVVLVDGELVIYVERGGRTLLTWSADSELLQPAVNALADAVRAGVLGNLTVERTDGAHVHRTDHDSGSAALTEALTAAGFHVTPRGLRLRP